MSTYNVKRRLINDGVAIIDGKIVADCVKFTIVSTPKVVESTSIGDTNTSRRYKGFTHKVTLHEWATRNWYSEVIKPYKDSGETPEFTFQGRNNDTNCGYYEANGKETATARGCVLTSDVNLINLDTEGDTEKVELEFGAYDVSM